MKLRISLILMGCLVGVSSQATMIPKGYEAHGSRGPLYDETALKGFQVMDVNLGMTLNEAAAALSNHGFKPVNRIVEQRTNGSKSGGEDVTFEGGAGELVLTYNKLTNQPARVSGVFYRKAQTDPANRRSFAERGNEFISQYGMPSTWGIEAKIENVPGASFSWFSQDSFRDDRLHKNVRSCHADWRRSAIMKGGNCQEILKNANSSELIIILSADSTLYMLNDYRATYESLRTNEEFMEQYKIIRAASGV